MDETQKKERLVVPRTPNPEIATAVWDRVLLSPVREFLNRPSKAIRHRLVEVGYRIAAREAGELDENAKKLCRLAGEAVEAIHAGSLVIDDIQDGSLLRRGAPTLHRKVGIPLALNAGNWLYFWPLAEVESWGLSPDREIEVYRLTHRCLLNAHYGQALDIGTPMSEIPQEEVEKICFTSLRLKTGALMALAIGLGAIAGGMTGEELRALEERGTDFGVSLQMFDDLGNLLPKETGSVPDPKQWEDLKLGRPSWVWAVVARESAAPEYELFREAVRLLPDDEKLLEWLSRSDGYVLGKARAEHYMRTTIGNWKSGVDGKCERAFDVLNGIATELTRAYEQ